MRKAINFDLDTNKLKKYYPGQNYIDAYKDLKKFFEYYDFEHRQYSGYVSKVSMKESDIDSIILNLGKQFAWLKLCVNKFDVTNVGKQYDMLKKIKQGIYKLTKRDYTYHKANKKSLDSIIKSAEIRAERMNLQGKSKSKENNIIL